MASTTTGEHNEFKNLLILCYVYDWCSLKESGGSYDEFDATTDELTKSLRQNIIAMVDKRVGKFIPLGNELLNDSVTQLKRVGLHMD